MDFSFKTFLAMKNDYKNIIWQQNNLYIITNFRSQIIFVTKIIMMKNFRYEN